MHDNRSEHSRPHEYSRSHSLQRLGFKQLDSVSVNYGRGLVGNKFTIKNVNGISGNDGKASLGDGVHGITAGRMATIQSRQSSHSTHFDGTKTVGGIMIKQ